MSNDNAVSRREWITLVLAAGGTLSLLRTSLAHAAAIPTGATMTVYKDPACGCCKAWISVMTASGFRVAPRDRNDMDALKDSLGIPRSLRSCHTAVMGKYVIEGHVPAAEVRRLLAMAPDVRGLAVPGMPAGSPGMEMGGRVDRFDVVAFTADGTTRVFSSH